MRLCGGWYSRPLFFGGASERALVCDVRIGARTVCMRLAVDSVDARHAASELREERATPGEPAAAHAWAAAGQRSGPRRTRETHSLCRLLVYWHTVAPYLSEGVGSTDMI